MTHFVFFHDLPQGGAGGGGYMGGYGNQGMMGDGNQGMTGGFPQAGYSGGPGPGPGPGAGPPMPLRGDQPQAFMQGPRPMGPQVQRSM